MALSYTQSSDLMRDNVFVNRVKVACLKFAAFIANEAVSVAGHSSRLKWATSVNQNPDGVAAGIAPAVVMDPQVQADGGAITDVNLQTSVETTVNKLI